MRRVGVVLAIVLAMVVGVRVAGAEVLTNDAVVTMVKAKLGEELIITKIRSTPNQFDLSTENIVKLKEQGVSDKVLQAMIESAGKSGTAESRPTTGPAGTMSAGEPGIPVAAITNGSSLFVKLPDRVAEILPVGAQMQHSMAKHFIPYYFGPGDTWYYVRGPKSTVRIGEKSPAFYTKMNPSAFLLLKLAFQAERDIRYAIATGSTFKGALPITVNKRADDLFELVPKSQLERGEYAFIAGSNFYDFAIE